MEYDRRIDVFIIAFCMLFVAGFIVFLWSRGFFCAIEYECFGVAAVKG
jgi:hypothetical protein